MLAKKQALVIGNGDYAGSLKLGCPANDAREMNRALTELGFDVTLGTNLTFQDTHDLVARFLKRVADPSTNTSLLYYSGHGVQLSDQNNYMVPIDFDHLGVDDLTQLVSVQDIVDKMTAETTVRIVLIDACRSNADAQDIIQASKGVRTGRQGAKSIGIKQFIVDGRQVRSQGLASMQSTTNTFIAFAAAPGEVAYEGEEGRTLSPFTESLARYLDVVDLPISNLTSRVRQDVLSRTQNMQRTWDTSSLMAPFYFNPGSLLLFMGNFMAIVGLVLSMVPFSLILSWPQASRYYIIVAALLPSFSLAILLFGMQSVYSRLRGNYYSDLDRTPTLRDHLVTCVQKGVLGGYLGSLPASLLISATYYGSWAEPLEPFGKVLLEITTATALTSCLLSVCSLFFARTSIGARGFGLSPDRSLMRLALGAAAGGVVAGLISGPILSAYFGLIHDRPEMRPWLLLPGAVVGSSIQIFSIVNFDFERLTSRRVWTSLRSSFVALLAGIATSGVVFGSLAAAGIVSRVISWMEDNPDDATILALGGAIYGIPVGFVLGATIGFAIVFTERWSRKPVLA
jgi:hypothetical protein